MALFRYHFHQLPLSSVTIPISYQSNHLNEAFQYGITAGEKNLVTATLLQLT